MLSDRGGPTTCLWSGHVRPGGPSLASDSAGSRLRASAASHSARRETVRGRRLRSGRSPRQPPGLAGAAVNICLGVRRSARAEGCAVPGRGRRRASRDELTSLAALGGGGSEGSRPEASPAKLDKVRFLPPGCDEEATAWAQVLEPANRDLDLDEDAEDRQLFAVADQLRRRGFALVDTGAGTAFGALERLRDLEPVDVLHSTPDRLSPASGRHLTDWAALVTRLQNAAPPADPQALDPMQALFAIPMECIQFRGVGEAMGPLSNLHVDAGRGKLCDIMEDTAAFPFGAFNAWWTAAGVQKQLVVVSSNANMGRPPPRSARYARRRGPGGPSLEESRDLIFVSPRDMGQKVLLLWSLMSPALADASEQSALLPPAPQMKGCRSAGVLHGASSIDPERLKGRSGEAKLSVVPLAALDPGNEVWRATAPPRTQASFWYWVARTKLAGAAGASFDYLGLYWQWVRRMLDSSSGSVADGGESGTAADGLRHVLRRGSEVGLPSLRDPGARITLEEGYAAYCSGGRRASDVAGWEAGAMSLWWEAAQMPPSRL